MNTTKIKLVLTCVECGAVCHAPLMGDNMRLAPQHLYTQCMFILSVVSPPGVGEVVMAPVCEPCGLKLYGTEVMRAAVDGLLREN